VAPLIALREVSKVYPMPGGDVHALRNVSLEIDPAELVAVVGTSGCGKTTMLYLLGLLTAPTRGRYELNGRPVQELTDRARSTIRGREIGFVFQSFHLVPQLDVLDNVLLAARYARANGADVGPRSARALIGRVGLAARERHRPAELSGGEMQRVAIARALLMRPTLILADEPTGNLDESTGHQIFDLLSSLRDEGRTIVLVTHDTRLAGRAQRQIRLRDGEVTP
jgi:putative ABC transport system ATP-binding protein